MEAFLLRLQRTVTVALALSFLASPIWAQDTLAPRGPAVDLDNECVRKPQTLTSGDRTIVVWQRDYPASGIYARQGAALDDLGSTSQLVAQESLEEVGGIPLPGGFAVVWSTYAQGLRFQRFDLDLAPLGPPVQVATGHVELDHDFDDLGNFALAFKQQGSAELEVRRYSSTGQQVGAAVTVALSPSGSEPRIRLGNGGFLVLWHTSLYTDTYARAFSNSGVPLGPVVPLGAGKADVARSQSGYLVLRGSFSHLLGEDGVPQGDNVDLGVNGYEPTLAAFDEGYWAAWLSSPENQILGAQLDLEGRLVGTSTALTTLPADRYASSPNLEKVAGGFRVSWVVQRPIVISAPPCEYNVGGFSQDFGLSRGVVDVPATTPFGLAISVLIFAAAGLLVRRLP